MDSTPEVLWPGAAVVAAASLHPPGSLLAGPGHEPLPLARLSSRMSSVICWSRAVGSVLRRDASSAALRSAKDLAKFTACTASLTSSSEDRAVEASRA